MLHRDEALRPRSVHTAKESLRNRASFLHFIDVLGACQVDPIYSGFFVERNASQSLSHAAIDGFTCVYLSLDHEVWLQFIASVARRFVAGHHDVAGRDYDSGVSGGTLLFDFLIVDSNTRDTHLDQFLNKPFHHVRTAVTGVAVH